MKEHKALKLEFFGKNKNPNCILKMYDICICIFGRVQYKHQGGVNPNTWCQDINMTNIKYKKQAAI